MSVLQQTLSQMRLTNIATLDACMNHFTRLIDLTSADEAYVASLATTIAPCILRPRAETSLTMEEKHAYRLVRDLFAHKDAIFSELKRMSTANHGGSINRPRAISTDESNRRANMEERNRALLEKAAGTRGRATSPAPSPRGHRRDRSTGGPETRFPIQTSPPASAVDRHRSSLGSVVGAKRSSLEVPGSESSSPKEATTAAATNGSTAPAAEGVAARIKALESPVEKRNSLGRSSVRYSLDRHVAAAPSTGTESGSSTPRDSGAPRGVTLEDKPMDD